MSNLVQQVKHLWSHVLQTVLSDPSKHSISAYCLLQSLNTTLICLDWESKHRNTIANDSHTFLPRQRI